MQTLAMYIKNLNFFSDSLGDDVTLVQCHFKKGFILGALEREDLIVAYMKTRYVTYQYCHVTYEYSTSLINLCN